MPGEIDRDREIVDEPPSPTSRPANTVASILRCAARLAAPVVLLIGSGAITAAASQAVGDPLLGGALSLDKVDLDDASSWRVRAWTSADGLPQNSVTSIAQTPDGYLWLGTFGGLVRFDGSSFTVFDVAVTPELLSNRITALCVDRDGRLWIGTGGQGLCILDAGRFEAVRHAEEVPKGPIRGIVEDGSGTIWIAGASLMRYADGRLQIHREAWNARGLLQHEGRIWATSWTRPTLTAVDDGTRFPDVHALLGVSTESSPNGVAAVLRDSTGQEWLAAANGLYRVSPNGRAGLEAFLGRELGEPRGLFEDREGGLWVGTEGRGLLRLSREPFARLPRKGLGLSGTYVIAPHPQGGLWLVATNSDVLWHVRDGVTDPVHELPRGRVRQAVVSVDGALWVGGRDRLLHFGRNGPARELVMPHHVSAIDKARDGGVWVAGGGRLT